MSFPAYPKYKDSGLMWLGKVPEHWEIRPLKFLLSLITEKATQRTNPVALENIQSWTGKFLPTESTFEGDGTAFIKGDILFGKLRPYLAKALLADSPGEAVGDFHVLRPRLDTHGRFAQYQVLNHTFITIVDSSTFGSKMPRAGWEFISSMKLTAPPLAEQTSIAAFLDQETAKIDALVEEQRRLMELLKEKRQALITHAVTKGLNPHASMKPSGVEWLGDVPAHWEIKHIKDISSLYGRIGYRGYTTNDIVGEDEGAVTLSPSNMVGGLIDLESCTYLSWGKYEESPEIQVQPRDVIMVKTGSTIGKVSIVERVPKKMTINPQLVIFKKITCCPWFLYFLLTTSRVQALVQVSDSGSTIPTMSQASIGNFQIAIPPPTEQALISEFCKNELANIAALSAEAQRAIYLLQERRTALISAAVTGQIDVRDAA